MRQFVPIVLVFMLAACSREEVPSSAAPAAAQHWVALATAGRAAVEAQVERSGQLRARNRVRIHAQEEGRIVQLPHRAGDAVEKGALLVALDDALIRAERDKAHAERAQREQDLVRAEKLVARKLISEELLSRARTALAVARADEKLLETRLSYTRIHAPFAGVVTERLAEPGDIAARHAHLLSLADPASLYIEATVSELLAARLAPGVVVEVLVDALSDQPQAARVERVQPQVDAQSRQQIVEIAFERIPPGALPGQLARARFALAADAALSVPAVAVRRDTQGEHVFVVDAEGKAHRRTVQGGARHGDALVIERGLTDGERVVVRGFQELRDGKRVEIAD
jgi:membrane fusion protein (multidrug efflux system)